MSNHPAAAALAAYVLGHHDEIDRAAIESHVQGCDECLDEVGREARLELLLAAAGREDAFVAVAPLRPRHRWPVVAAAVVAVAAAAGGLAVWRSRSGPQPTASHVAATRHEDAPVAAAADPRPAWARGLAPGDERCVDARGTITCAASSKAYRLTRDDARDESYDAATEALVDRALTRGGPAITAQRALYLPARKAALTAADRTASRPVLRAIAAAAPLGARDTWYWEEYESAVGAGNEFLVWSSFSANAEQIREFLARYSSRSIDGAELVPTVPGIRWLVDPGEQLTWFVHRPGRLAEIGIESGDVLLMNPRRVAGRMRWLLEVGEATVWRAGLTKPVLASQLP